MILFKINFTTESELLRKQNYKLHVTAINSGLKWQQVSWAKVQLQSKNQSKLF